MFVDIMEYCTDDPLSQKDKCSRKNTFILTLEEVKTNAVNENKKNSYGYTLHSIRGERESQQHRSEASENQAGSESSNVRFPPTGSFGELEQRQGSHVTTGILWGRNANEWGNLKIDVR